MAAAGCGVLTDQPVIATAPLDPPLPVDRPLSPENVKLIGTYGGVYEQPRLQEMVNGILERLVAASETPLPNVRATVLNSPAVNAFALPSGDLYVTRGLIALANDESELAAVIAHEIAHLTADHARLRQRQAEAAALAERVSDVVIDPRVRADTRETAATSRAVFTQAQELEADDLGVDLLARAGFDPFAAARFLTSMARYAKLPSPNEAAAEKPGFLSSHPTTPARVERAKQTARRFGAPGLGRTAQNQYLRALDGMLFGDDPRQGFVRGREFAHIELGIAFTMPESFVLKNTAAAVLATDGQHTAVRFDAVSVPKGLSLGDYLASGWVKGLVKDSIRSEVVGGLDAATASALVDGWSFRIGVIRGPRRVYRFIFASSRPASSYEEAFRSTLASFRVLTPSEKAAMRPLRLRVVTVRPNESAGTLAARVDGFEPRMKLPLFNVLNGRTESDPQLRPGDQVKIVTE